MILVPKAKHCFHSYIVHRHEIPGSLHLVPSVSAWRQAPSRLDVLSSGRSEMPTHEHTTGKGRSTETSDTAHHVPFRHVEVDCFALSATRVKGPVSHACTINCAVTNTEAEQVIVAVWSYHRSWEPKRGSEHVQWLGVRRHSCQMNLLQKTVVVVVAAIIITSFRVTLRSYQ
jgi:hypothetical protein